MQLHILVRFMCAALLIGSLTHHAHTAAQAPALIFAANDALVFELTSDPSITRHLSSATTAKLATPAQHTELGLTYPLWLSDAVFLVKTRTGQRQSIMVTAKRGNPTLTSDLLVVLNNQGVRVLEPQILIFDKTSTFAGSPMPPASLAEKPDISVGFADSLKASQPITFLSAIEPAQTIVASSLPVMSNQAVVAASLPYLAVASKQQAATRVIKFAKAASSPTPVMPAQVTPGLTLVDSAPSPTPPLSAPPSVPRIQPTRPPPSQSSSSLDSWLQDASLLAGLAVGILLFAYLAFQLWKTRRNSTRVKRDAPSHFAHTLSANEQVANTVFGLNASEADAMHKNWLAAQLLPKK